MASEVAAAVGGYGSSAGTVVRSRRWVQRDHTVRPFVWHGLLPLLGLAAVALYALGPFARVAIESRVRDGVTRALTAAGLSWPAVAVSGQHVVLSGAQPAAGAGDKALAVARAATCATWAGPKLCAVDVQGMFTEPVAPPPAPAVVTAPVPAVAVQAAARCEKSLAALLQDRRIEFATSRSEVASNSNALLDELAQAAKDCPGVVRIEGHTDAIGSAQTNQALSQARAEAVRAALVARGIAAERLAAQGFGPDRPIGDNATAAGRAKNRRIEFKVLPP